MSEFNPKKNLIYEYDLATPFVSTGIWGVAHTHSRCEKKVAEFFDRNRVPHFLPLVQRRNMGNREIRNFQVPLFPGYVFFNTSEANRLDLLKTGKVATIIESDEPKMLCKQLENLAHAIEQDEFLCEARYGQVGKAVRIVRGKLKGLCGEIVRIGGRSRLLIRVDFVGRAAVLDIDESMIEAAL